MKIKILTLFPEMYDGFLTNSIIKRAIAKDIVSIEIINIRDYTKDRYHRVDTPPIGGGAGLIMKCQPIVDALRANNGNNAHKILMSPRGKTYSQEDAIRLAKMDEIILLAGHYEGIDERVNDYIDETISIGDYILTGGEIATMAIADSIIRLLKGAIAEESLSEESFSSNLLEYPQYTEPRVFEGKKVPDILYSGNHEAIKKFRLKESLRLTKEKRLDLFKKHEFSKLELKLLDEINNNIENPKWLQNAIKNAK